MSSDNEAAHGVPVEPDMGAAYNPLTPAEDVHKLYEWQAVPAMGAGDAMAKMIQSLRDEGFHYASTNAPPIGHSEMPMRDRGGVHLYRLRKDKHYVELEERRVTQRVLEYQKRILELRVHQDEKAVELAEYRKAHPDMGW
jgi:hypothetical protein